MCGYACRYAPPLVMHVNVMDLWAMSTSISLLRRGLSSAVLVSWACAIHCSLVTQQRWRWATHSRTNRHQHHLRTDRWREQVPNWSRARDRCDINRLQIQHERMGPDEWKKNSYQKLLAGLIGLYPRQVGTLFQYQDVHGTQREDTNESSSSSPTGGGGWGGWGWGNSGSGLHKIDG